MTSRFAKGVVAAALALAAGFAPAATAAPPSAVNATLTEGLRVQWRGNAGIRLRVPQTVRLPAYGARLTVRDGSYAFARWRRVSCPGGPCVPMGNIDWVRGADERLGNWAGPGTDHLAATIDYGTLRAGTWEWYLFTDGIATLTFDDLGLPEIRQTFTAAGRVRARVAPLTTRCAAPACTPDAGYRGRLRVGGDAWDVGAAGSTDVLALSFDAQPYLHPLAPAPTPQGHAVAACTYPVSYDDTRSARPEDHPMGCDSLLDKNENGLVVDVGEALFPVELVPTGNSMRATWSGNQYAHGLVYQGFMLGSLHDVTRPVQIAYGIWYSHGIR